MTNEPPTATGQGSGQPTKKAKMAFGVQIVLLGLTVWAVCGLLCGCSTFRTEQTEYSTNGLPTKSTVVVLRNVFQANSEMTKLRTTFTDKSQGIGVGSISENASSTNLYEGLGTILGTAIKASK